MVVNEQKRSIQWAAKLEHVHEVSLLGTADLNYWQNRLRGEELSLATKDGKAQVLIISAEGKFLGLRFAEMSISVLVAPKEGMAQNDAAFLVQAYNSLRFFAFVERNLFSTPYQHGDVQLSTTTPISMCVRQRGEIAFQAVMQEQGAVREPIRQEAEGWEGPVYLPGKRKVFFARVHGMTRTYPFVAASDSLLVHPSSPGDVLHALQESRFTPIEWIVRDDAEHAKSKTYQRTALKELS